MAAKFLRQIDIFKRGELEQAEPKPVKATAEPKDDTQALLKKAEKEKDDILEKDMQRNDLVNQIRSMDKSQLDILANDRWGQKLHNRLPLENARAFSSAVR